MMIEAVPCGEQDGDGSSGVARRDGLSGWCQLWMVKRSPASAKKMLRTAATGQ
jgi:hypothetical protein